MEVSRLELDWSEVAVVDDTEAAHTVGDGWITVAATEIAQLVPGVRVVVCRVTLQHTTADYLLECFIVIVHDDHAVEGRARGCVQLSLCKLHRTLGIAIIIVFSPHGSPWVLGIVEDTLSRRNVVVTLVDTFRREGDAGFIAR